MLHSSQLMSANNTSTFAVKPQPVVYGADVAPESPPVATIEGNRPRPLCQSSRMCVVRAVGPQLYVFPGFGLYSRFYLEPISVLCEGLAEPVFVDLPNHGRDSADINRSAPTLGRAQLNALIKQTATAITAHKMPCVLLGESLGCSTAIRVALAVQATGGRCGGLILISPPVAPRARSVWRWTRDSLRSFRASLRDGVDIDPIYREMIEAPDAQEAIVSDPRVVHRAPIDYLARSAMLSAWLALRGISQIAVPALAMVGEHDPLTSADNAAKVINRLNPDVDFRIVPGARHGLLWDQQTPHVIFSAREWLEGVLGDTK